MQNKICPYCRQGIPPDSVKCHHCREWVDWRRPAKRILLVLVTGMVLAAGFALAMDALMPDFMSDAMFDEQRPWQQPDAIQITSHHAGQDEEGSRCVIGTMENVSTIPWRFITLRADYYNSEGDLVDTSGSSIRGDLPPGQQRNFKVVFGPDQREAEYDHYRISITDADDASRL
jgi:predicted nucleic acid-binding Zn ribbon protein